jgi:hypothetical protein
MDSGQVHSGQQQPASREGLLSQILIRGVRFFQTVISPVDGDRCTMTPTCSHFSLQAIQKHGPVLGFMMTADRIVHEYEEQRYVPLLRAGPSLRYYDPVENNDFWFSRLSADGQPLQQGRGE